MTLNASGPISLGGATAGQSVNLELGKAATAVITFNDAAVRTLTGTTAGTALIMPTNFYGKSTRSTATSTYSASTSNATLNVAGLSGYVAGLTDITVTINAGIYIYSTSAATPALTLTGGVAGDTVTLVNNGYIMGQGGTGGDADNTTVNVVPTVGGPALKLGFNTTVNNTNASAYIGGGGGGGAGGSNGPNNRSAGGGGGAGGGVGGVNIPSGQSGGAGGAIGSAGGNGNGTQFGSGGGSGGGGGGDPGLFGHNGGGGGGRIFAGTGGAAGAGGGAGGSANNAGAAAAYAGGGGGWGASGGTGNNGTNAAAAGGKAVDLNGKTITWTSGNTTRVYGSVA